MSAFFHTAYFQDSSMLCHLWGFHSFLRLKNIPSYVYTPFCLSLISIHLGCFYFTATMNNAVQIFVYVFLSELMLSDF